MPRAKPPPSTSPANPRVPEKWIRNAADHVAIKAGCWFDQSAADHVCTFFETFLCHSKGKWAGVPFKLAAWQRDWLSRLFGWKRPDGTRRYREAYLEVPKKNGKSTILSGICLYGLMEEAGAEVYTGAVDRSQASIIFDECAKMVAASPFLSKHLKIVASKKTIVFPARGSKIEAMSADAPSKDGRSASLVVLDETHRFKSPELYDVMKYAGAAREQPLLVNITTAGYDRNSLCYTLHQQALAIIDGTNSTSIDFLPVIYAASPDDNLDDPKTWAKANPSMGSVLSEENFAKDHQEAKMLPRLWNLFLRLRLNIWTEAATRWIPIEQWKSLKRKFTLAQLKGLPCYAGLDLSTNTDLTCLCLVFIKGDFYIAVPYFFLPTETIEVRSKRDKQPYRQWVAAGHAIETPGNATDYEAIRTKILAIHAEFKILNIALDPWNAQQLSNQLVEDGFSVEGIAQTFAGMSGATKELERLILDAKLLHDGHPVLEWCARNVAVITDANENMRPSKKKSTERIDGIVALIDAIHAATTAKPEKKPGFHFV